MAYQIMTHIVAGYPTLGESEAIARTMLDLGVEHMEIQIPFSDPAADGPVITAANHVALENGTSVEDAFALMQRLSDDYDQPIYFMTYANIPLAMGYARFCERAVACGAKGIILPDLPYDQKDGQAFLKASEKAGLPVINVIAPWTHDDRLAKTARASKPMVYCVAGAGTTGQTQDFSDLAQYLARVKAHTDQPLAVGFGISSRADMDAVGAQADIVVIGSEIIRRYRSGGLEGIRALLA